MMKFKKFIITCLSIFMLSAFGLIFSACGEEENLKTLDVDRITIVGQRAVYDGEAHIFSIKYNGQTINTVRYSKDGGNTYQTAIDLNLIGDPTKETTYVIYYKISIDGFKDFVSYAEMTIELDTITSGITIEDNIVNYDGSLHLFTVKYKGQVPENLMFSENENYGFVSADSFKKYQGSPDYDFTKKIYYKFKVSGYKEYKGSAELIIKIQEIDENKLDLINLTTVYDGNPQIFSIRYNGDDITNVGYSRNSSDDRKYVKVFKECINAGSYTIFYQIKVPGFKVYESYETFVIQPRAIKPEEVAVSDQNCVYTGFALEPMVVFTDSLITENDYILTYTNNKNAGNKTALVTIQGQGNFVGLIERGFTIKQKELTIDNVQLSTSSTVYNAKEQAPEITVKDEQVVLKKDEDFGVKYTLSYKEIASMINAGTYYIIISGKNNYKGEFQVKFRIEQFTISVLNDVKLSQTTFEYDGIEKKPDVTIKNEASDITVSPHNYKVTYESNVAVGNTAKAIISLKEDNGVRNYKFDGNTQDAEKTFAITPQSLKDNQEYIKFTVSDIAPGEEQPKEYQYLMVYNGNQVYVRDIVVKGNIVTNGVVLTNNVHYRVSILKNGVQINEIWNAGTYHIAFEGINNFTGRIEKSFTIQPKQLDESWFTLQNATGLVYNGQIKDNVAVINNDTEKFLTNSDYTISKPEIKDAREYTITVTGQNNYAGTLLYRFSIAPKIVDAELSYYEVAFDGTEKRPVVTIQGLEQDKDFAVKEYINNVNSGVATVVVEIINTNYAFENDYRTKQFNFTITGTELTDENVTISDNVTYNGLAHTLAVACGENPLRFDIDYTVVYKLNGNVVTEIKNVGEYQVEITGKGAFFGSVTKTFNVAKKDVTLSANNVQILVGQDATSVYTATIEGLVDGDSLNYTLTSDYTNESVAGSEYVIVLEEGENPNYNISYTQGTLKVVDVVEVSGVYFADLNSALAVAEHNDEIVINTNLTVSSTIIINKNITLNGNDFSIIASEEFVGTNLVEISTNVEVDINNVTLDANNKARVVKVSAGTLNMYYSKVVNGLSSSYVGGVFVTGTATITVFDSEITGNDYVDSATETEYYKAYSQDLWIGSQANGMIRAQLTNSVIGNVFVNANEYSLDDAGLTVNGGTINTVYVEYYDAKGAKFEYVSGTINNLLVSSMTTGEWIEGISVTAGKTYIGGAGGYAITGETVIGLYSFEDIPVEADKIVICHVSIGITLDISNLKNVEFVDCKFSNIEDYAVQIGKSNQQVKFDGCLFEACKGVLAMSDVETVITLNNNTLIGFTKLIAESPEKLLDDSQTYFVDFKDSVYMEFIEVVDNGNDIIE